MTLGMLGVVTGWQGHWGQWEYWEKALEGGGLGVLTEDKRRQGLG